MSRHTRVHDAEWETDPAKELSRISGGAGLKKTTELSRPKPDGNQESTPLVSSDTQGWDIDDLAARFTKHYISVMNNDGVNITPCSMDALYFQKNDWVFVEFKDDAVVLKENDHCPGDPECEENDPVVFQDTPRNYKAWLQRKLYDTQYMFAKYGKCWDSDTAIAYIVVKHGGKNSAESLKGDQFLRKMSNHLKNVIYPHYEIFAGMKFMYRYIHLVDETVFERDILKDLSHLYTPSE